jgi:hypothetical protein
MEKKTEFDPKNAIRGSILKPLDPGFIREYL